MSEASSDLVVRSYLHEQCTDADILRVLQSYLEDDEQALSWVGPIRKFLAVGSLPMRDQGVLTSCITAGRAPHSYSTRERLLASFFVLHCYRQWAAEPHDPDDYPWCIHPVMAIPPFVASVLSIHDSLLWDSAGSFLVGFASSFAHDAAVFVDIGTLLSAAGSLLRLVDSDPAWSAPEVWKFLGDPAKEDWASSSHVLSGLLLQASKRIEQLSLAIV